MRYLAPQKISSGNVRGNVKLYFRVLAPEKDVTVIARLNEEEVYRKKKKFVNPGEIESVEIKEEFLKKCEAGQITVEVRKGEC
ncbi:MAG: hypothetical protein ACLUI9_05630 [[Clostridium] scindens]